MSLNKCSEFGNLSCLFHCKQDSKEYVDPINNPVQARLNEIRARRNCSWGNCLDFLDAVVVIGASIYLILSVWKISI